MIFLKQKTGLVNVACEINLQIFRMHLLFIFVGFVRKVDLLIDLIEKAKTRNRHIAPAQHNLPVNLVTVGLD